MASQETNGNGQHAAAGISIQEVRDKLTDLVNRAAYAGDRIAITKNGKVVAFIVSPEDVQRLEAAQRLAAEVAG